MKRRLKSAGGASPEMTPKTTAYVTAMTAGPQEGASAEVRGETQRWPRLRNFCAEAASARTRGRCEGPWSMHHRSSFRPLNERGWRESWKAGPGGSSNKRRDAPPWTRVCVDKATGASLISGHDAPDHPPAWGLSYHTLLRGLLASSVPGRSASYFIH